MEAVSLVNMGSGILVDGQLVAGRGSGRLLTVVVE